MILYPYQNDGVAFLASRRTALLADDPGLGKTLQAIRAADAAVLLSVLVICPASVVETWRREIARYRQGDWEAMVMSYEMAVRRPPDGEWDALIVDEAHYLKTETSKRSKMIYGDYDENTGKLVNVPLVHKATRTWILTGTPMPNDPTELFPHLKALHPSAILSERTGKPWTIHQFTHGYCKLKSTGFGMSIVGTKNEAKLNRKLEGFMLRRRKADVLKDLPPLTFGEVFFDADVGNLPGEEVAAVREALARYGVAGLKKVAGHVAVLRRLTGVAKAAPAAEWIRDWLAGSTGKLVVFAHHTDVIATICSNLPHDRVVAVRGDTPQHQRQINIDTFQNDSRTRVFIGNIQAAGTGITLTAASDLLFVESSWVPAEMEQAAQRIHRIGQTSPCLVRFTMLAGSIDEDIQRAVARKMASIEKVVDGVS